jgi:hypothetical protein
MWRKKMKKIIEILAILIGLITIAGIGIMIFIKPIQANPVIGILTPYAHPYVTPLPPSPPPQTYIHPTVPGLSMRDYSKGSIVIDNYTGQGYYTMPGIYLRDYSKPGFILRQR